MTRGRIGDWREDDIPMPGSRNKSHKSAVVVIPPKESWEPIQELRRVWDRQLRRWMPHITLLYPFRPARELGSATLQVQEVCASFSPFMIRLERFRSFKHATGSHTIWLDPEPAGSLVALQDALWRAFPDCDDVRRFEGGYTPHLSVGQCSSWGVARVLGRLNASWTPLSVTVDRISIITRGDPPEDIFSVTAEFALG